MTTVKRRPKWTPPPPSTPRILHIPHNHRTTTRRKPKKRETKPFPYNAPSPLASPPPVVLLNSGRRESVAGDVEEREDWRFQIEMLRAECFLLRMERDVAVKKLENERGFSRRVLKSTLHSLVSGKKKIDEGGNVSIVFEEEIEELSRKLMELQKRSLRLKSPKLQECNNNFDKQAAEVKKQLEECNGMNHSGGCCLEEIELSGPIVSRVSTEGGAVERRIEAYGGSNHRSFRLTDVETLRRKMERLSKGKLLKRMEEVYGSMVSASNYSISDSTSNSRRYDLGDLFSQSSQEVKSGEVKGCSGQCKAIVKRIMEQVKAETEQWSEMQELLGLVREEMESLQDSKDFWESRALKSDVQIQTLQSEVEEWKQKTKSFKNKENQLHNQLQEQELHQELEKLRIHDNCTAQVTPVNISASISLGAYLAKENRALTCQVKERRNRSKENTKNKTGNDSRITLGSSFNHQIPFKDIGNVNVSPLERHNSRRYVYPLHTTNDS